MIGGEFRDMLETPRKQQVHKIEISEKNGEFE
jgi:hypothetical protein